MRNTHIDDTLNDVDYKNLYRIAEWHEKQSTILKARAIQLQQDLQSAHIVSARVEFIRKSPEIVLKYIKQGHSAERACQFASQHSGIALTTINSHWKKFLADKSSKAVKKRNLLIFQMHGMGFSNVNIADRLSLHPVTVCRILRQEKEKRLVKNPNPQRISFFIPRDQVNAPAQKPRQCQGQAS